MALPPVDHLVYAAPSLYDGIEFIALKLGLRAVKGGSHPGLGTHNAVLGLGGGAYLEIIAPDPDQPPPSRPLPFGLAQLTRPRLVTWAVRTDDIERRVAAARKAGYDPGEPVAMSRELPAGGRLTWRIALNPDRPGDGIVPFLIQWDPGPHPAHTAPFGLRLLDLRAQHPDPAPPSKRWTPSPSIYP